MITRDTVTESKWPVHPLVELCEFLDHRRRPVTESERIAGPYPYFGANGKQGTIDRFLFDEPLVLLAEDGGHFEDPSRGVAYRVDGKTWVNNHAHVLRPKAAIDIGYLSHVLKHYDVTPYVTGTTRGKLTKSGASNILIPLPCLAKQRRIAAILDQAEALRAKRRQALAKIDTLNQSLFLDHFRDYLTLDRHNRTSLNSVAEIASGVTKGRLLRGQSTVQIPYLRVANVQSGYLDLTEIKTIQATDDEIRRWQLQNGDILMTEGGDFDKLGRGAVWRSEIPECIHQNHVFRVRLDTKVALPEVFHFYLQTSYVKQYFLRCAKKTSNLASINMSQLKELPVFTPPIAMQRSFCKLLEKLAVAHTQGSSAIERSQDLFLSLQHRAFRGEL